MGLQQPAGILQGPGPAAGPPQAVLLEQMSSNAAASLFLQQQQQQHHHQQQQQPLLTVSQIVSASPANSINSNMSPAPTLPTFSPTTAATATPTAAATTSASDGFRSFTGNASKPICFTGVRTARWTISCTSCTTQPTAHGGCCSCSGSSWLSRSIRPSRWLSIFAKDALNTPDYP